MSKRKVMIRLDLVGYVEVSEETYGKLDANSYVDIGDVDLPWDDIANFDGDVELCR